MKILTAKVLWDGNITEMLLNTSQFLFTDKILIVAIDSSTDPKLERSL